MALRKMSVDIDFGVDLSEINKIDDSVDDAVKSVTGGMNKAEKSVNGLGDEFSDLASDSVKDMAKVGNSIKDIGSDATSSVSDLKKIDKALADVGSSGSKAKGTASDVGKIGTEASESSTKIRGLGNRIKDELGDNVQGTVDELTTGISGLGSALAGLGVGLGAAEIISSTNEMEVAFNSFEAQTGANSESMAEFSGYIKELYTQNLGESMKDVSDSMALVHQTTGLVGEELKTTTQNALVMRDTFGFDIQQSVKTVNTMMRRFGLTSEEAYNLLAQGAQEGLNQNDDLLDMINEYSPHFASIGIDAEEMFNMLKNGADTGTWQVEKLGDAIKEFSIRAIDSSAGTVEAFTGLGMNADEMMGKLASGGDTAKQAFSETLTALMSLEDPVKRDLYGVALFGTMWEDVGEDAMVALGNMSGEISTVEDDLGKINEVRYDDAMTSISGLGRTIQTDIADKASPIVEGLGKAAQFMADNWNWLGPIVTAVAIAIGLLATTWGIYTIAQNIANMAIWACPFVWIVVAIVAVIAIIITLIMYWDEVVAVAKNVWNGIVEIWGKLSTWFMENVVTPVVNFFSQLWEGIKSIASSIATWFDTNVIQPIVGFFTGLWNSIMTIVNGIINFVMNTILPIVMWFWNYIINPIIQIFAKIWEIITTLVQVGIQYIMSIVITIVEWINVNIVQPIVNFFMSLWNRIVQIWNMVVSSVQTIWGVIAGWVNANVVQPIVSFFTGLWNSILSIFSSVASFFTGVFSAAYNGVTSIFSGITSFFSGIWESIKSIFTNIGQSIADGVSGAFKSTVNAVIGFAESTINGFIKGVNAAIDLINAIPGVSISKLSLLSIPRLATGGVVEGSTVANIGEAGAEAVVPLENNLGWLNKMGGMIAEAILSQARYQPSSNAQSSGGQSITVEEGAIQITISDSGNASETANKVKNTIESFFAQLRKGGSYAVTEV